MTASSDLVAFYLHETHPATLENGRLIFLGPPRFHWLYNNLGLWRRCDQQVLDESPKWQ